MTRRFVFPLLFTTALIAFGVAASALVTPVADWKIAGPFGGTATSVALDPQKPGTLLAGAMNSLLFRTQDAGENWELLDFPKRNLSEVTSVLVDPDDSKHYLAGVISADGGALFESRDNGKTWAVVKSIQDFGVRALAAAPSKHSRFVAGTGHGVMLSDDSGATWQRVSDPKNLEMQGITAVAIDTQNPDIFMRAHRICPGRRWMPARLGSRFTPA